MENVRGKNRKKRLARNRRENRQEKTHRVLDESDILDSVCSIEIQTMGSKTDHQYGNSLAKRRKSSRLGLLHDDMEAGRDTKVSVNNRKRSVKTEKKQIAEAPSETNGKESKNTDTSLRQVVNKNNDSDCDYSDAILKGRANNDYVNQPSLDLTKQSRDSSTCAVSVYWGNPETVVGEMREIKADDRMEEANEDDEQSDSDWEEVAELPFLEGLTPVVNTDQQSDKPVEITLEAPDIMKKKKKKGQFDWKDWYRLQLNKFRKKTQKEVHMVHLLCLISYGLRLNRLCNDATLQAIALSLVPAHLHRHSPSQWKLGDLHKLVLWFSQNLNMEENVEEDRTLLETELLYRMEMKMATRDLQLVLMFVILCRAMGLDVRLINSLQPTTAKATDLRLKTSQKSPSNSDVICIDEDLDQVNKDENKIKNSSKSLSSKLSTLKQKRTIKENVSGKAKNTNIKHKRSRSNIENKRDVVSPRCTPKNQQRRRCSSKVSYVEKTSDASDSDDLIDISATQVDGQSDRKPKAKPSKTTKSDTEIVNLSSSDEDFEPYHTNFRSPNASTRKRSESKDKPISSDVLSPNARTRKRSKSTYKPISSDVERGTDYWSEVFLENENKWICMDCVNVCMNKAEKIEARASKPLCYVLGYSNDGIVKDVTSSYASNYVTQIHKLRVDPKWWEETLLPYCPKTDAHTERDAVENSQIQAKLLQQPLPNSISELKNHKLYVLQRHLLKFEALYPSSAIPVGYLKGEAIYARECVYTLHSRDIWLKEGKDVKMHEEPYKQVKSRKRIKSCGAGSSKQEILTPLFGFWQTEEYVAQTATDGIVPKNAYGNVDLFKPTMLPPGTVQLRLNGLNKIARKLGVDCPSAMVGFEQHGGFSCPVMDGFVVCEEFKDTLEAAWEEDQMIQLQKAAEKRQAKVLGLWKTLIKGLLVRERMKSKFKLQEPPKEVLKVDSTIAEQATDAVLSWPRNKQAEKQASGPSKKKPRKMDSSVPFPFEKEQL